MYGPLTKFDKSVARTFDTLNVYHKRTKIFLRAFLFRNESSYLGLTKRNTQIVSDFLNESPDLSFTKINYINDEQT